MQLFAGSYHFCTKYLWAHIPEFFFLWKTSRSWFLPLDQLELFFLPQCSRFFHPLKEFFNSQTRRCCKELWLLLNIVGKGKSPPFSAEPCMLPKASSGRIKLIFQAICQFFPSTHPLRCDTAWNKFHMRCDPFSAESSWAGEALRNTLQACLRDHHSSFRSIISSLAGTRSSENNYKLCFAVIPDGD